MKLAIVFDDLIQNGGAEKLLESALEIWPNADVYTATASEYWKDRLKSHNLCLSFVDSLPYKEKFNKFYASLLLHSFAYQSLDLNNYDVVLSISARFAHHIKTKPSTKHICYMNSPGRMFWEPFYYFHTGSNWKSKIFKIKNYILPSLSILRMYDRAAAQQVDYFIANSKIPQNRIKKYYGRNSSVIHPYADPNILDSSSVAGLPDSAYFLVVSRLVRWKKIDYVIEAFNNTGSTLVIVGTGPDKKRLRRLGGKNVIFLDYVSEETKYKYMIHAEALIVPQYEDFGITPVESMFCGTPVIAYGKGGVLETVVDGKTGMFYFEQNSESLLSCLSQYSKEKFHKDICEKQAKKFTKEIFQDKLKATLDNILTETSQDIYDL